MKLFSNARLVVPFSPQPCTVNPLKESGADCRVFQDFNPPLCQIFRTSRFPPRRLVCFSNHIALWALFASVETIPRPQIVDSPVHFHEPSNQRGCATLLCRPPPTLSSCLLAVCLTDIPTPIESFFTFASSQLCSSRFGRQRSPSQCHHLKLPEVLF